ncbi:MAG: 50S ribosomal protein L6 [Planctomycetota bacterium]|mgnify:CR=1 FL=1
MSRIGKKPVLIPDKVKVTQKNKNTLLVEGPRGKMENIFHEAMIIKVDTKTVVVERPSENRLHRSLHGLTRALIENMVKGVSQGFERRLELQGVGYTAKMEGKKLFLTVGYANPIKVEIPPDVTCEVPVPTQILVKGTNKQKVGQLAADIRRLRPPEPYKGKGIRYEGEHVIRKIGKAFGKK